ncbi:Butyrophilin-like protein 8, partial [Galemys pyrenaicus]
QWQVIGPDSTVQILVGEDAVFSCSLSPETSAEAMEVLFFRDHFSDVIHLYRDGKDQNDMQIPDYRGRTELLKDSLVDGCVSLRLKKVTLSDAGLYGCWFRSWTYKQKTSWDMQVSALGSAPLISITGYFHGGIQLLCKSSGWFPKPIVKWKGSDEHNLPSDTKVNANKNGLFDVETSFTIQENSGSISCSIQLTDKSQELESKIWIGDTFFQPLPWRLVSISLGVLCSILCMGITGLIIFYSIFKVPQVQMTLDADTSGGDSGHRHSSPTKVTLDTDMAHPQLYISGLKSENIQVLPNSKKRFNSTCEMVPQVFRAGKHYWEVDVGHNDRWCLGVYRNDADMKAENLSPNNGYWVLQREREQYFTCYPHISASVWGSLLHKWGVFLDYEGIRKEVSSQRVPTPQNMDNLEFYVKVTHTLSFQE